MPFSSPTNTPYPQVVLGTATSSGSVTGRWFAASSHLNTVVATNPTIDANSANIISKIVLNSQNGLFVNGQASTGGAWSAPVYFCTASDPLVTITLEVPWLGNSTIQVARRNTTWITSPDPDGHYVAIRQDTGDYTEFQRLNFSTLTAHAAATGNVFTGLGNSINNNRVAVLPTIAGLIRPSEVASGVIPHALRMAFNCGAPNSLGSPYGYRYPAIQSDGGTNPNGVPAGGHLWLPRNISLTGLDTFQTMCAVALQTYGGYVSDSSGSSNLYAESTVDGSSYSVNLSSFPRAMINNMVLLAVGN